MNLLCRKHVQLPRPTATCCAHNLPKLGTPSLKTPCRKPGKTSPCKLRINFEETAEICANQHQPPSQQTQNNDALKQGGPYSPQEETTPVRTMKLQLHLDLGGIVTALVGSNFTEAAISLPLATYQLPLPKISAYLLPSSCIASPKQGPKGAYKQRPSDKQ